MTYSLANDYMYAVIADTGFDFNYFGSPYSTVASSTTVSPFDMYYGGIAGPWSYAYASTYLYNEPTLGSSYLNGPSIFYPRG